MRPLAKHCNRDTFVCVKGRPKGVREEDVYICEYRVDRTARRFTKIKQGRYPVNCKSYCFNRFLQKLRPKRTYVVCFLSALSSRPFTVLLLHCVSKKVPTFKLSVTLSDVNRLSKFLHCLKAYEICYKTHSTLSTSS